MSFYKWQTKEAYARWYKIILAKHMKKFIIIFLFSNRERGLATFCTWVVHFYLCLFTSDLAEHKVLANWKYISKNIKIDDKTLNIYWTMQIIKFFKFSFCLLYVYISPLWSMSNKFTSQQQINIMTTCQPHETGSFPKFGEVSHVKWISSFKQEILPLICLLTYNPLVKRVDNKNAQVALVTTWSNMQNQNSSV